MGTDGKVVSRWSLVSDEMPARKDTDLSSQLLAFHNVAEFLDHKKRLPEQMFVGQWAKFFFFASDHIFTGAFAEAVCEILCSESSQSCCMMNLTETKIMEFQTAATFFFKRETTSDEYYSWIRRTKPELGWLYTRGRHVCATEIGAWCMYCESNNEIAVVALRNQLDGQKFRKFIDILKAKPIDDILKLGRNAPFPFNELVPAWRYGLVNNYSRT